MLGPIANEQEKNMEINATSGLLRDIVSLNKELREEDENRLLSSLKEACDRLDSQEQSEEPPFVDNCLGTTVCSNNNDGEVINEGGCSHVEEVVVGVSSPQEEAEEAEMKDGNWNNDDIRYHLSKTGKQTTLQASEDNTHEEEKADEPINKRRMISNKMMEGRRKMEIQEASDAILTRKRNLFPNTLKGDKPFRQGICPMMRSRVMLSWWWSEPTSRPSIQVSLTWKSRRFATRL